MMPEGLLETLNESQLSSFCLSHAVASSFWTRSESRKLWPLFWETFPPGTYFDIAIIRMGDIFRVLLRASAPFFPRKALLKPGRVKANDINCSHSNAGASRRNAWFSALCGDDYEFLGVPDGRLRISYQHCGEIVRRADNHGFQNILLPSGWIPVKMPWPLLRRWLLRRSKSISSWRSGWGKFGQRCWLELLLRSITLRMGVCASTLFPRICRAPRKATRCVIAGAARSPKTSRTLVDRRGI